MNIPLYRAHTASQRFVCFDCRLCFHRPFTNGIRTCNCGKPMMYAGDAFRAPRRRDHKEWARVETLIRNGLIFNHDGAMWTHRGQEYLASLPKPQLGMRKTNGKRILIKGRYTWRGGQYRVAS